MLHLHLILFIGMVRAEAHLEALTHYKSSPSEVQIEQWVKMAIDTFLIAFKSKINNGDKPIIFIY